ncbi:hypothetical protein L195_g043605, partial [Trifolium pratense]
MAEVSIPPCLLDGDGVGSSIDVDLRASVFVPKEG